MSFVSNVQFVCLLQNLALDERAEMVEGHDGFYRDVMYHRDVFKDQVDHTLGLLRPVVLGIFAFESDAPQLAAVIPL
jgi:hypothetical protein